MRLRQFALRPKLSPMSFASLLTADRVIPELRAVEHWPAIVELVDRLVKTGGVPAELREPVLESLREREDQCSTGIGGGNAIPHIYSDQIDEVLAVFGRSKEGIEFGAIDNAPVFFVVLLIVPKDQYNLHLKTLASVARLLSRPGVRRALEKAEDAREIVEALRLETAGA